MSDILEKLCLLFPDADFPEHNVDMVSREELRLRQVSLNTLAKEVIKPKASIGNLLAPNTSASVAEARQRYVGVVAPQTVVQPFEEPPSLVGEMLKMPDIPDSNPVGQIKSMRPEAYVPPPPLPSKAVLAQARQAAQAICKPAPVKCPPSTISTKTTSTSTTRKTISTGI